MAYGDAQSGRQVSGAAVLARQRRELERRAAVRRALASRQVAGGGVPVASTPASYYQPMPAAQVFASNSFAPSVPVAHAPQYGLPAPQTQPARMASPTSTGPVVKNWWEQDTGPKKVGIPKHGKSMVAGFFDGIISLFIFAIAPAALMSKAASDYGLDLGPQIMGSALAGCAIAAFAFLRWMFMRGTRQRLLLSLAQVMCVVAWILVAISPNIDLQYYDVEIHIGLLRYLLLAGASYALMSLYFIGEYVVYKPMYEDIRRAKLAV